MSLQTISLHQSHGGMQGFYKHFSKETNSEMAFSVFVPQQLDEQARFPVVWYLSGFASSPAHVTERGEFRRACAELGLIFVAPDTRPRGDALAIDPNYTNQKSIGAGCYLDATMPPFDANYRMLSYIVAELPETISRHFPVDANRQGILGHSSGGHAALMIALRSGKRFRSASALSPILSMSRVPWGEKMMAEFLGPRNENWRNYDVLDLLEDGHQFSGFLIDSADGDNFYNDLDSQPFLGSCLAAGIPLTFHVHPSYDQSNYFVSSFMEKHLRWHAHRLNLPSH